MKRARVISVPFTKKYHKNFELPLKDCASYSIENCGNVALNHGNKDEGIPEAFLPAYAQRGPYPCGPNSLFDFKLIGEFDESSVPEGEEANPYVVVHYTVEKQNCS
jgi:hypothetical protein